MTTPLCLCGNVRTLLTPLVRPGSLGMMVKFVRRQSFRSVAAFCVVSTALRKRSSDCYWRPAPSKDGEEHHAHSRSTVILVIIICGPSSLNQIKPEYLNIHISIIKSGRTDAAGGHIQRAEIIRGVQSRRFRGDSRADSDNDSWAIQTRESSLNRHESPAHSERPVLQTLFSNVS